MWLWLLAHPRLIGWASLGAGLALMAGVILAQRTTIHRQATVVQAQAVQAKVTTAAQAPVDRLAKAEPVIRQHGEVRAHAVERAPGGDTPVAPDVLAGWSDGIRELRDEAERARDPGGRGAAPAVPATGRDGGANRG